MNKKDVFCEIKRMKMKLNFKNVYFLPFIIIIIYPFIVDCIIVNNSRFYFALIIASIVPFLIKNIFSISPFLFVIISLPVFLLSLIYNVQISEYNTYVNQSTWPTILNTNPNEASEFLSSLRTPTIFTISIQIATYIFYFIYSIKRDKKIYSNKQKYILIGISIIFIIDFSLNGATQKIFPYRGIASLIKYTNTKRIENKYLKIKNSTRFDAKRNDTTYNTKKETIVIVIGESLRRDHLQYYGYDKETTPLLNKEDLIVFTDVISPANQTINSLKRIFTLAEYLDEVAYWKYPSLIKAFKEVGFKTYWLTAQPPYGDHESEVSFIGKESDFFLPIQNTKYDTEILKQYNKVLDNNILKKLILIHIKGNHYKYSERYPKNFNVFSKIKNKNSKINIINEYDNSVRFNDYFLSEVLGYLKQVKGEKSFIMFSDHGESLFDTSADNCYHGSAKPAKGEFIVPLILWLSKEFKNNYKSKIEILNKNKGKAIILTDFFHSFPSLYGITFKMLNEQNNFFGENYKSKENRYVMNPDYKLLKFKELKKH